MLVLLTTVVAKDVTSDVTITNTLNACVVDDASADNGNECGDADDDDDGEDEDDHDCNDNGNNDVD